MTISCCRTHQLASRYSHSTNTLLPLAARGWTSLPCHKSYQSQENAFVISDLSRDSYSLREHSSKPWRSVSNSLLSHKYFPFLHHKDSTCNFRTYMSLVCRPVWQRCWARELSQTIEGLGAYPEIRSVVEARLIYQHDTVFDESGGALVVVGGRGPSFWGRFLWNCSPCLRGTATAYLRWWSSCWRASLRCSTSSSRVSFRCPTSSCLGVGHD